MIYNSYDLTHSTQHPTQHPIQLIHPLGLCYLVGMLHHSYNVNSLQITTFLIEHGTLKLLLVPTSTIQPLSIIIDR